MVNTVLKVAALGSVMAVGLAACDDAEAPQQLFVYNWSDYIAEDTIEKFEAATGIEVIYDVFDSNEVLESKLLAGGTGYDIVVPSGSFLERQIMAGVFQPLDRSKLPNIANLDADLMARVSEIDPDNAYSVPYMWGTTGIGYNVDMVAERLGPDAPVDSWSLIFDPENAAKLADCGITVLDAPTEMIEAALKYLGMDPHSDSTTDHMAAQALLSELRPHVRYFHSSQYINDLANGDVCVSVGWSGDVFQARDRAAEAEAGVTVDYRIPKEGTVIWFDLLAIPTDAENVEAAHQFIDFLMEPQVIADITNYVWYANPNAASYDLVDPEITGDPAIYPDEATMANLFADRATSNEILRLRTRIWTEIKTGT